MVYKLSYFCSCVKLLEKTGFHHKILMLFAFKSIWHLKSFHLSALSAFSAIKQHLVLKLLTDLSIKKYFNKNLLNKILEPKRWNVGHLNKTRFLCFDVTGRNKYVFFFVILFFSYSPSSTKVKTKTPKCAESSLHTKLCAGKLCLTLLILAFVNIDS